MPVTDAPVVARGRVPMAFVNAVAAQRQGPRARRYRLPVGNLIALALLLAAPGVSGGVSMMS